MEHISKPIETVLGQLPAANSDNSESPTPPEENPSASSSPKNAEEKGNLATRWQRIRIGLQTITPAVQAMATETEQWCNRVRLNARETARLIVLSGVFGCGKTQMLKAAHGYVRDIYMRVDDPKWGKSLSISLVRWPEFLGDYITNRNDERLEDIVTSDVVFIDDIGAEADRYRSGEPNQILGELLGSLDKKFVFITTNIQPDGWKLRWDGRVEDRLLRNGSVVVNGYEPELNAQSYAKWRLEQ